jgi:hypothetical protein
MRFERRITPIRVTSHLVSTRRDTIPNSRFEFPFKFARKISRSAELENTKTKRQENFCRKRRISIFSCSLQRYNASTRRSSRGAQRSNGKKENVAPPDLSMENRCGEEVLSFLCFFLLHSSLKRVQESRYKKVVGDNINDNASAYRCVFCVSVSRREGTWKIVNRQLYVFKCEKVSSCV